MTTTGLKNTKNEPERVQQRETIVLQDSHETTCEASSKNRWLAFVLSLVALPGAGHFYLGKKKAGTILSVVTISLIGGILYFFVQGMTKTLQQMENPTLFLTQRHGVMELLQLSGVDFTIPLVVLGIIWIGAALDTLR